VYLLRANLLIGVVIARAVFEEHLAAELRDDLLENGQRKAD
jgi:hypothetical protein